ncbi:MAG TPA: acyl-CoA dehydrogenase family protein [Chloroflexota bacterium]|jgi:alkylation response protein AidB-like acyl-CoA dehydrogenase
MDVRFTPEQEAWREEVIAFLRQEITPAFREEFEQEDAAVSYGSRAFSRKLAERGWLTLHWPREYGGQERSFIDQAILNEQLGYFQAPTGSHNMAVNQVGVPLIQFGTPEQKARFLPRIASHEIRFGQAFTEPEAGSDLASLKTTALRDGDAYVVNGLKVFISSAHRCEYLWLLARTDPSAARHHDLSVFVVDVNTPGIRLRGVPTINHGRVNDVYFEEVRVPAENLIGPEHGGWQLAMTTLNIERSGVYGVAHDQTLLADLIAFARETERGGRRLADDPLVRHRIAWAATELEAQRMLSWRVAWLQSQGQVPSTEASLQSLRRRVFEHEFANFAMDLLGLYGQLARGSPWARLRGQVERLYLNSCSQHAGGTTEIQKNIIVLRGLELPRR